MQPRERAAAAEVRHLLYGQLVTQALCAVAELGLPDMLAAGPLPAAELARRSATDPARRSATDPARLRQLMTALVPYEIFSGPDEDAFALGRLGRALTTDAPGSALASALMAHRLMSPAWQGLLDTVRSGVPAFDRVHGSDLFSHLEAHPDLRALFDRTQAADLHLELDALLATGRFAKADTLVDVGGGNGALLAALLHAHRHLRGILVDRPSAAAAARTHLAEAGVADRATVTSGDFFKSLPPEGDLYLMREILHDWDDQQCVTILRTCRFSMPRHGRLLVVELADETPGTGQEARAMGQMSLYMLSVLPGRERHLADYTRLLDAAGLHVDAVHRLTGRKVMIEAR
ncbi:methyltransferase [Streptomyces sp. NPDC020917]|uniref:methyltransferase n=1 Tax=Streptomyces sp. NPDC020917 TaxID=3365102 RepID=UPI003799C7D7